MKSNCVICSDDFNSVKEIMATKCGHIFHSQCLFEWLDRSKTCPNCRNPTHVEDLIEIYLNIEEEDPKARIENLISSLVCELHKGDEAREEAKNLRTTVSDLER